MQAKITKKLKLISSLISILLLAFIISCSQVAKDGKKPEWNYPPDNPFPSIFTVKKYDDQKIGLVAELKPKTIKMSCRLRNDSPYYWCDFEGELVSPVLNLPKKISSTFHVVVAETGKNAALNFAKRIKKSKEPTIIILEMRAAITNVDNSIYSQLFGIYNSKECFDVFENYSLCPKTAKKLNIFTGKFLRKGG
jgi:hypothetical protein